MSEFNINNLSDKISNATIHSVADYYNLEAIINELDSHHEYPYPDRSHLQLSNAPYDFAEYARKLENYQYAIHLHNAIIREARIIIKNKFYVWVAQQIPRPEWAGSIIDFMENSRISYRDFVSTGKELTYLIHCCLNESTRDKS